MPELTIYGFAPSTYTRTTRLVCEEKGVDYVLEPVPFDDVEAYRRLNPYLKMPVLRHGDLTIFETLAIATYVDLAFDGPALRPADPRRLAAMLQWISAANDSIDSALVRGYVKAGENAGPAERELAIARLQPIDNWLIGRSWLAGDALTLADLFLAPMVAFALQCAELGLLDSLPELTRWFSNLEKRESFQVTRP
jgi:glutathione S-transferase